MKIRDHIIATLRERCLNRRNCKHCIFYRLGNRVSGCAFEVQPWEWETGEEIESTRRLEDKFSKMIRNGEFEKIKKS